MNFLLSLSSSWFSKLAEFILARFAVNSSPALLKRRLHAAEAGRPVLSLTERFLMWGNEFNRSILFETQARYPSSSPVPCDLLDFIEEKNCCLTCSPAASAIWSRCCLTYTRPVCLMFIAFTTGFITVQYSVRKTISAGLSPYNIKNSQPLTNFLQE